MCTRVKKEIPRKCNKTQSVAVCTNIDFSQKVKLLKGTSKLKG